jgi:hypothetical protein
VYAFQCAVRREPAERGVVRDAGVPGELQIMEGEEGFSMGLKVAHWRSKVDWPVGEL